MSTLGEAIYARLTTAMSGDGSAQTAALAAIGAAVGGSTQNPPTVPRIYPRVSDENGYPCIVYETTQEDEESLQPMTAKEFGVSLRLICQGEGAYKAVHALKNATRTLLDRKGSKAGAWGGVTVSRFLLTGSDEADETTGGNEDALFFEVIDQYTVWAQA